MNTASTARARALYIPHGGGPLPLLNDEGHAELVSFLSRLAPVLGRPSVILVASAHWEEPEVRATSSTGPWDSDSLNDAFQAWLSAICASPREEHLLPLRVCAGFSDRVASKSWEVKSRGREAMSFLNGSYDMQRSALYDNR